MRELMAMYRIGSSLLRLLALGFLEGSRRCFPKG